MPRRAIPLIFSSVLLGLAGGIATRAQSADQAPAVGQSSSAESADQLLAKGKEIFLERYARCHNDRGDKPLKTGLPLNERELSSAAIAQAVSGRLRDRPESERRAVTLYISSLMQNKDSGKEGVPKPWSEWFFRGLVDCRRAASAVIRRQAIFSQGVTANFATAT